MISEKEIKESQIKEESFNDKLDVLRHVSDIKMHIKNDITNDFVLAKLEPEDKRFIIEMTGNAYFSKKLIDIIAEKGYQYIFDKETQTYKKVILEKEQKQQILLIGKAIFDTYMIRIYMLVVLNRNVEKNHLINILSGYVDKDEGHEMMEELKMRDKVKTILSDENRHTIEK